MVTDLNGPPYRSETPSPIRTKLNTIHYVWGKSSRARTHHQPIKRARSAKGIYITFLLVFIFFLVSLLVLSSAPNKNGCADFDDLYVKRRSLMQESAFQGSQSFGNVPYGVHFPQFSRLSNRSGFLRSYSVRSVPSYYRQLYA
jgi:hypothetical protein